MKKNIALALAVLVLLCAAPALGEENQRLIHVTGNAVVSLAADTATIQIGVNTRKLTVKEAQKENAELMAAVLDALHQVGVEDKDIITSQFNVSNEIEYQPASEPGGRDQMVQYYRVQNNVSVTLHDMSMIGKVLDAAMDAGANTTYGITFSSTHQNEAYQKALTRAVEDAMQKAKVLAAAAGVQLGSLVSMNATPNTTAYSRDVYGLTNSFALEAKSAAADTVITGGDITVSAEVTLEYEFQ